MYTTNLVQKNGKPAKKPAFVHDSSPVFTAKGSPVQAQPSMRRRHLTKIKSIKERRKRLAVSPAVRLKQFNHLISCLEPTTQLPLIEDRPWLRLLSSAMDKDQMQKIIDLFPKCKDAKEEFPGMLAEAFARRCHALSCSELALTVFGDFAKYNLTFTLAAGRWLLHSLCLERPISQTFLAASYYPAYNLPPITEDLPSAVMLAVACYNRKYKTSETVKVAEALLPHVRKMWTEHQKRGPSKTLEEAEIDKWVVNFWKRLNKALSIEKKFALPPEIVTPRID